MRPVVAAVLLTALSCASVRAEEKQTPVAAPTVAMEAVAMPIVVDGKLVNYVFCSIRLDLAPKADGSVVRAKEQYFRDDLVRAAHRTPFTLKDDYNRIDEAKVRAEVLRFAPSVVGPGVVVGAVITKQSSQKNLGLPADQQPRARPIVP